MAKRTFTANDQKRASALLQQAGADEATAKTLVRAVGNVHRRNNGFDVQTSVRHTLDAIAVAGPPAQGESKESRPAAKSTKAAKATKKQTEKASQARQPRRNARDLILLTALENDWKVTEHRSESGQILKGHEDADAGIRPMHPNRGRRDWSATMKKGKVVFTISTIRNNGTGGIHPDGGWLTQDGKVTNVEMLYSVLAVLSSPLNKQGMIDVPDREAAKKLASNIRGATAPAKQTAKASA